MNPDVPEAHKLRGWYDDVGHNMDYSEFQGDGSSGGGGGKCCFKTRSFNYQYTGLGHSSVTIKCKEYHESWVRFV